MASPPSQHSARTIGLFGATSIGVGAIVGGGILAISGAAFAATGPSAILAFALNGLIALATALSFAEMSSRFPESGGSYTFAKKLLSVETAFLVGWVVWFASVLAAVLYALGFGAFLAMGATELWRATRGTPPELLSATWLPRVLALVATLAFAASLTRKGGSGGTAINVVKVVVFAVLIAGGLAAFVQAEPGSVGPRLSPFFSAGASGLFGAMGVTFIALQGFDLIAAAAGEVREPERTIPRAMLLSLGGALLIYLPLLFVIAAVGVAPGASITSAAQADPEGIVAQAALQFLGPFGYWLVIVAGLLAMLSALQANLFAASRVAQAMALDRTLPKFLAHIDPKSGTPSRAVWISAASATLLFLFVRDVAAAGSVASLVFLVSFTLAHAAAYLARRRDGVSATGFTTPFFPAVPVAGGLACAALAIFQGVSEKQAGALTLGWLLFGGALYLSLFASRARVVDAAAEGRDPHLARMRGRNPMVLVPVANPANTGSMIALAHALTPPYVGRVLLLSVVRPPKEDTSRTLVAAQELLGQALAAAFERNVLPATLTTIASDTWVEIERVARAYNCQTVLLGLPASEVGQNRERVVEELIGKLDSDAVVLRAPHRWQIEEVERVLVPVASNGAQDVLRARLLGSLQRTASIQVTYLRILPDGATDAALARARFELLELAHDELGRWHTVEVVALSASDAAGEIARLADEHDLVLLGLQRVSRRNKLFGSVALEISRTTDTALILISNRG